MLPDKVEDVLIVAVPVIDPILDTSCKVGACGVSLSIYTFILFAGQVLLFPALSLIVYDGIVYVFTDVVKEYGISLVAQPLIESLQLEYITRLAEVQEVDSPFVIQSGKVLSILNVLYDISLHT